MKKAINWWKSRTLNEKLMYSLIIVLSIGILVRVEQIWAEICSAFGQYFSFGSVDSQ